VATSSRHRKALGDAIRLYRKASRLTHEKLAELADLHPNYIGEVERGETNISVDALVRIAKALRVRVRDLVADI
jgi:XRE family transcriptional regulator, regulator of sulfur utilization